MNILLFGVFVTLNVLWGCFDPPLLPLFNWVRRRDGKKKKKKYTNSTFLAVTKLTQLGFDCKLSYEGNTLSFFVMGS